MIKTKKQMFIMIGAFLLTILLGTTTYAFFNYTRTGSSNVIKTGRIAFNSEQGTAINLTNMFPIDTTVTGIMNDSTKVGTVTINVTGDTTYTGGIEYKVSAVNVQNTVGNKHVPISINVSVENNSENDPATNLGTLDNDYFTNRGTSAQSSIYKVLAGNVISEGDKLLVGYIKSGATGVDGNIVIKAYIDKANVAISDSYTEGDRYEVLPNLSSETLSDCVTHLESINYDDNLLTGETLNDFCSGTGTIDGKTFQETLDRGAFDSTSLTYLLSHNIIRYLGQDGTTDEWVHEREVLTTSEWNSLQANGVSFQVKVESNEGTWVENPNVELPIASCATNRCVYTDHGDSAYTSIGSTVNLSNNGYHNDYDNNVFQSGYWLGFVLDENDTITEAYLCTNIRTINYQVVCVRGGVSDQIVFNENFQKITEAFDPSDVEVMDYDGDDIIDNIGGNSQVYVTNDGSVMYQDSYCGINDNGTTYCSG